MSPERLCSRWSFDGAHVAFWSNGEVTADEVAAYRARAKRQDSTEGLIAKVAELGKRISDFEHASGISLDGFAEPAKLGNAVRFIMERGERWTTLRTAIGHLERALEGAREADAAIRKELPR